MQEVKLTDLTVTNSIFSASLISFQSVDLAFVEHVSIMKSTFRNNIITLNDVRDISFESLEIMENESSDGGLSLFDYEAINAELGKEIFFSA